jgi:two-component system phosphate regulon response regulator OmpR
VKTNYRILIVDKDPRICRLIRRYLEHDGYGLDIAVNGKDMLRKLSEANVDLILLDALLPAEDSFTFVKELRAVANIRIIKLVDNLGAFVKVPELEFDADDYVMKPLNENELLASVRRVLRDISPKGVESNLANQTKPT